MNSTGNIVIAVMSFIGLSGFVSAIHSSRRLSRHHRFFRFRRTEPIDFVLTTSARTEGGYGITYRRSVTAVGNLKGSAEIAQTVGYGSPRRPIQLSVSAELESRLSGDLVVIGLPGKNEASRTVLTYLCGVNSDLELSIDEKTGGCGMSLDDFSGPYSVEEQPESDVPTRDLGLIVLWVNPLTPRKRRLILCGGFTAYGTAAAASYLVDDIVNDRLKRLQREHPALPSLWRRQWICFVMIVEIKLINDQVVDVRERKFVPLPDPGSPPFKLSGPPPDWLLPGEEGDLILSVQEGVGDGPVPGD